MNSWCKVENGQVVDGPRAWNENTPPDQSWVRHRLEDQEHTINDNFDGSEFQVRDNEVVEVKKYSPKPQSQIDEEVNNIKTMAQANVEKAKERLADPDLQNRIEWENYRNAWDALTSITALSWGYRMPSEPEE